MAYRSRGQLKRTPLCWSCGAGVGTSPVEQALQWRRRDRLRALQAQPALSPRLELCVEKSILCGLQAVVHLREMRIETLFHFHEAFGLPLPRREQNRLQEPPHVKIPRSVRGKVSGGGANTNSLRNRRLRAIGGRRAVRKGGLEPPRGIGPTRS